MVSKVGWLFGVQDPFTVRLRNPGVGVGPGRLGGEGWSPGVVPGRALVALATLRAALALALSLSPLDVGVQQTPIC